MKQVLKNIFSILTPIEKKRFVRLIILDVVISVLDIVFLIALLVVINFYTQSRQSIQFTAPLFTIFENHRLWLITIFFVLFSIKNAFGFYIFRLQYQFVYAVASRISKEKLLHYFEGSYTEYIHVDSAIYMRKIGQQPIEFCHYVLKGVQQIISQVILIFITIIPILIFNPVLFPMLFLILVPPVIVLGYIMKTKLVLIRMSAKKNSEQALQYLKEALSSYVESKVYDKNEFFTGRYNTWQIKLNQYLSELQIIQNLPSRLIEVFAIFGLLILILINAYSSNTEAVNIITIGAFIAAAYKIIPGIIKILNSASQIKTYSYTTADLLKDSCYSSKKTQQTNPVTSIEFNNVSFAYEKENVLTNFCLKIGRGDLIGISGRSGKGKTTIINLLLGFLQPAEGKILINDITQAAEDIQQFWKRISYVKQQLFLIHDTILKNITLEEGGHDIQKLMEVMAVTGVDELAKNSMAGIDTIITEDGKNLSGGQRQRIILARALYKKFDLLILDEPFNELDEHSEILLLRHLQKISGEGKIVLLITHNKTGLSFCNKKVNLNE